MSERKPAGPRPPAPPPPVKLDTSPGPKYTGSGGRLPDHAPGGSVPCERA